MINRERRPRGRPRSKTETALARWLDQQGIERSVFAKALKIDRSTVDRICRGERRPDLDLAFQIQDATHNKVPASIWVNVPPHSRDPRK